MNPKVDAFIRRSEKWPDEMTELRPILLSGGLVEEFKWGKPCYSHEGSNIVILQEMKEFLALMFFKRALLNDPESVLEEQGPNSRSARRADSWPAAGVQAVLLKGQSRPRQRTARVEKYDAKILDGRGFRDR